MKLLAHLADESGGLQLRLPRDVELTGEGEDNATFTRAADESIWWLFHHRGMSMDISPARFDELRVHAQWYARAMFEDTSRALEEDPATPLRTADPTWSPLVAFERIDLDGGPAARSIHRMVYRAGREMIMGHLLVPLADGLFEARVLTVDTLTGYREAALMLQFAEQDNVELPDVKVEPGRFDDPQHDPAFERHCLSRARSALDWIASEGSLCIRSPGHAAEQAEVRIASQRSALVPPSRFYPAAQPTGAPSPTDFQRVSFCSTDGVERLMVHRHPGARPQQASFEAWATQESTRLYRDDPSEHASLSVTTRSVEIGEGRTDVLVRAHTPGQARVLLWWIDTEDAEPVYLALNTSAAVPEDIFAAELEQAARSWRALPPEPRAAKKPWWKLWA